MSRLTFTHAPCTGTGRVHDATAKMADGHRINVAAAAYSDRIEIGVAGEKLHCWMLFTTDEARSVAAELLACVAARDALTLNNREIPQ